MLQTIAASVCLGWYLALAQVCNIGTGQIFRYYRKRAPKAISETLPRNEVPHITIIRPVKGVEPYLYECLAATFLETYPADKLTIFFCVSTRADPSFPILQRLVEEYSSFDVKILVEEEDELLQSGYASRLGPNPKIRNMSRAYREAKGDIVWIVDCNVWVGKGVAGRMVDVLNGYSYGRSRIPYKFVHQMPLVVDVTNTSPGTNSSASLLGHENSAGHSTFATSTSTEAFDTIHGDDLSSLPLYDWIRHCGGGRLEELFMASSHAKFYTTINTILLAPCIVGKSNMFRRSHLNSLTSGDPEGRPEGIDFFSHNICEDHLIGDLLWKNKVPAERGPNPETFGKHCMAFGDPVIQPVAGMSVAEFIARRARWLRVRKFTVTLATLVEPGTESILDSLYGSFAMTTLPWFEERWNIQPTWTSFFTIFFLSLTIWCFVDWLQYQVLHSMASVQTDQNTPAFARRRLGVNRRSFPQWFAAWLGRELLALPIWTWAVFGGVTVTWRGQKFKVGMDARVHAIDRVSSGRSSPRRLERGIPSSRVSSKARTE